MKPLRDVPIQRKLTTVLLIASTVTLLLASTSMVVWQWFHTRTTIIHALTTQARILATNCTAAVAFNDPATATELLAALKADPNVVHARLELLDGTTLGEFVAPGHSGRSITHLGGTGLVFSGPFLAVSEPVLLEGKTVARLQLEFAFSETRRAILTPYFAITAAIFAANLLLAFLLSARLQRLISLPILELSAVASRVAEEEDYSVRATPAGQDELGRLTAAFNAMLARIEAGDTALRQANAELAAEMAARARLNRELVDLSREAGMAEVATGVLHNVGNVLNSVNVSATMLRETVAASELPHLARTAELLLAHSADLAGFFARDPRGPLVPQFLRDLSVQLASEHARLAAELTGLSQNVEHIKEIVAMQQSYARAAAMIEQVKPSEVFLHALRIQGVALQRHQVRVIHDFSPSLPTIATDRHNVLQILTNFVANAIHATAPNPPGRREISVAVTPRDDHLLAFTVRDNGVGIPREHFSQLFRLGFTTRKNGHGFGLHAGVLAARTLGGSIEFASDGPGTGATFSLVLPLCPAAPAPHPSADAMPLVQAEPVPDAGVVTAKS